MEKQKKKSVPTWALVVIILGVLALIGYLSPSSSPEETEEPVSEVVQERGGEQEEVALDDVQKEEEKEDLTTKERIEFIVVDELGSETNMGEERIVEILVYENEEMIELVLKADENLTTTLTKRGMVSRTKDLTEQFFNSLDSLKELDVFWQLELVDNYGNSSFSDVMDFSIDRETAEKINWENITNDNFEGLTKVWEHNAIK